MGQIKISKRLKKISTFVEENQQIFDIGSNHAYLPIFLIQSNKIPNAIASEISEGPYEQAIKEVKKHNLEHKLEVRLGDGFVPLNDTEAPGTIFICGMGSNLIKNILMEGIRSEKLPNESRLVLQPNKNEKELRLFLKQNYYKIIAEEILEEKNKIYEIIVAEKVNKMVNYSMDELLFGPILLKNKNKYFFKKWEEKLIIYEEILKNIPRKENNEKEKIEDRIKLIKRVLL